MLIVPILSSSLPQNHFTRCTKTASKFILYCSDIEQAKPRCTALEDRSGIDPVTQSKELHTFYAKINSVSVTEQKKHKSKRDKIWTCAFFQPNPNCRQLLAAFWSINSFQLVQWSPFYLLVQRRLLTAAVNVITFWYWEKKKTELHLKLGNLQSSEAFRCIIYFFRALHEKFSALTFTHDLCWQPEKNRPSEQFWALELSANEWLLKSYLKHFTGNQNEPKCAD